MDAPNRHAPLNPFEQLITACADDPEQIQDAYQAHRLGRNEQFKNKIIEPGFSEWRFDEYLGKILAAEQGLLEYEDPRHNLSLWARPPTHIRLLVKKIQQAIVPVAGPSLWPVPEDYLHITALEMVSGKGQAEVDTAAMAVQEKAALSDIIDYTLTHSPRLVRPMVSYDSSALALSFLPATGNEKDRFTYHHLRRDLWDLASKSGCDFASRYNVPSAHVTIARFALPPGHSKEREVKSLNKNAAEMLEVIEKINRELESDNWETLEEPTQGEWVLGQERGLTFSKGTSWYGNGETVATGRGF